jgi:glutamate-1-semialdehyde 2,1-aminomutase
MMTLFFGPTEVRSWDDASTVDRARFSRFFHAAHEAGVLVPPSPFEALFLMRAHRAIVTAATKTLVEAIGAAV